MEHIPICTHALECVEKLVNIMNSVACEQLPQNLVGSWSLCTGKSNSLCFASMHCIWLISWDELNCVHTSKQKREKACPSVTQRPQRGQRSHWVFGAGVPRLSSLDTSSWGLFIVEELQEGTGWEMLEPSTSVNITHTLYANHICMVQALKV